jgi:uroporphyrinogen decarboxylase
MHTPLAPTRSDSDTEVLANDLFLRAARGEQVELMRQAGRILPEYRSVRESISGFKELVETPELAAEVTVQPIDLLGVDAAIIFSDILVVPEAMGCTYLMEEKRGPVFPNPIRTVADAQRLIVPDVEQALGYVPAAIRITKYRLQGRVPLIGFAGAPWTLLSYMVEGSGSKTFSRARALLVNEPAVAHTLLQRITDTTIAYLKAQIAAGANVVQLFDSWAGILSPAAYEEFALRYIGQIVEGLKYTQTPVTVFAKGAFFALEGIAATGCNTVGIDWHTPPATARQLCGPNVTLQGNLDPADLLGSDAHVVASTEAMLAAFGPQRYIANLGHGVYPETNPDRVRTFIQTVKAWRG